MLVFLLDRAAGVMVVDVGVEVEFYLGVDIRVYVGG